jgi:hypothetical protein
MEDVKGPLGLFCGRLVYFTVIWYILRLNGTVVPFWYVVTRKIWQPCYTLAGLRSMFTIQQAEGCRTT